MNNDSVPVISEEQKKFCEENGYLILRDVLSQQERQDLVQWTKEVKEWPNVLGAHMPYEEVDKDGRQFLTRTENYANYHKGFGTLLRSKRLTSVLAAISNEPMVLFKEKINYKAPGGGGFDAHIDSPAYQHISALKHLTILISVEPASMENGCLEVVPGSQNMKIPQRKDLCITDDWCKEHTWVPVPLDTGDMCIFGSFLAHRSSANKSSVGRAAIYATYNALAEGGDQHDDYYLHRRKLWPPTFEREAGKSYKAGYDLYAWGTPMTTIEAAS